jgi:hypothetical protein
MDHENQVVVSEVTGRVAVEPASSYLAATFGAEGTGYDELVIGLHDISIDMKPADLKAFLTDRGVHRTGRPSRIAMIDPDNSMFGVARMIAMVAATVPVVDATPFREVSSALAWLGLPADYATGAELLTDVIE